MPATKTVYARVEIDGTKPITRDVKHAALIRLAVKDWTDNREVSIEVQTNRGYPVVHVSIMRVMDGQMVGETHTLEVN